MELCRLPTLAHHPAGPARRVCLAQIKNAHYPYPPRADCVARSLANVVMTLNLL